MEQEWTYVYINYLKFNLWMDAVIAECMEENPCVSVNYRWIQAFLNRMSVAEAIKEAEALFEAE